MTLVALFRSGNRRVLVGDLLVSWPVGYRRWELTKKVVRLSDSVVVAWAGPRVKARAAFSALWEARCELSNVDAVVQQLESLDWDDDLPTLHLAGWIGDQGFKWDSGAPFWITPGDEFYFGSDTGWGRYFFSLAKALMADNCLTPEACLLGASNLMATEMATGRDRNGRSLQYGFAYDFLFADDGQPFRPVSNVQYELVNASFSPADDSLTNVTMVFPSVRTFSDGLHTLVQTLMPLRERRWQLRSGEPVTWLAGPPHDLNEHRTAEFLNGAAEVEGIGPSARVFIVHLNGPLGAVLPTVSYGRPGDDVHLGRVETAEGVARILPTRQYLESSYATISRDRLREMFKEAGWQGTFGSAAT